MLLLDSHIVTDWHYVSVLYILLYKECEALYKAHQRHLVSKSSNKLLHRSDRIKRRWRTLVCLLIHFLSLSSVLWQLLRTGGRKVWLEQSNVFPSVKTECMKNIIERKKKTWSFCKKFRKCICIKPSKNKSFGGNFKELPFFTCQTKHKNMFFFKHFLEKTFFMWKNLNFFSFLFFIRNFFVRKSFYSVFTYWKKFTSSFFFLNFFPVSFLEKKINKLWTFFLKTFL